MIPQTEIEKAVDNDAVKGMQLIFGAFTAGMVIFLLTTLLLYFTGAGPDPEKAALESVAYTLTLVVLFFTVSTIPLSGILFSKILKLNNPTNARSIVDNIRSAMLVRIALFEGAALFGITTLFIGITDGYIQNSAALWLNLVPVAYFLLHVVTNFPTKDRVIEIYRANFTVA